MPTTILTYISMGFLGLSLLSNGWQYIRNVTSQRSLIICENNLNLQNQAIANIKNLQAKLNQYQNQISMLAVDKLEAQSQTRAQLEAPNECHAAIQWGIQQSQEFPQP